MTDTVRIYGYPLSGHSHRVELFAGLIGIDHEFVEVDLKAGEHKEQPFLDINPSGQVPAIQHGEVTLADSNAILVYLAKTFDADWLPEEPVAAAQVQRFLSLAAGELRYGPAVARVITVFGAPLDAERAKDIATWVFDRIEADLQGRQWLVGDRPTIADVAIYSYTAHAPEGNVSLAAYPEIRGWLARVEALPGFVPMVATKVGLAA